MLAVEQINCFVATISQTRLWHFAFEYREAKFAGAKQFPWLTCESKFFIDKWVMASLQITGSHKGQPRDFLKVWLFQLWLYPFGIAILCECFRQL